MVLELSDGDEAMRRVFSVASMILVLTLGTVGLAACDNTIRGVGQDLRDTGDALEGN